MKCLHRPLQSGEAPSGLALDRGTIWVTNYQEDTVTLIDLQTHQIVATIPVGKGPSFVAIGQGAVLVANQRDGTVSWIEPETHEVVAAIPVARSPTGVAVGEEGIWVSSASENTVSTAGSPDPPGARDYSCRRETDDVGSRSRCSLGSE